jgi:hypothetical protein
MNSSAVAFNCGGLQPVRAVLRGRALRQLAKGVSAPRIAEFIALTPQAIWKVGHRYAEDRLERVPYERERPGAAALLEESQKQQVIASILHLLFGDESGFDSGESSYRVLGGAAIEDRELWEGYSHCRGEVFWHCVFGWQAGAKSQETTKPQSVRCCSAA